MTLYAIYRSGLLSNIMAFSLALPILCAPACRKSVDPNQLILQSQSIAPPPSAANVIKIDPPPDITRSSATAQSSTASEESAHQPAAGSRPQFFRHWLMLLTVVMIALFLLSLVIFHTLGRRLRQRSFKPHPPTRHADIWASHKPPEFIDP